MLQLLNISNIALIDDLKIEFDNGLNLLTGETGSGKSIIVDALGVLIGGRLSADLLKSGTDKGSIEGLFLVDGNPLLNELLEGAGISFDQTSLELIIRREISAAGRNKIFINNQLATQSFLKDLREFLVDIHGQGEQQTLFNPDTHLELLDSFANNSNLRQEVLENYTNWHRMHLEQQQLSRDEAERYQLVDTLRFQIGELERGQLEPGEDDRLEEERRRLANVEKLTELSQRIYSRVYEDDDSALARLRHTTNELSELSEYESRFRDYLEGVESARAVLEDLSFSLRDFADSLEFSPARLAQVEDRLVELSRIKRKYGGSLQSALDHLATSEDRLRQIESADEREQEISRKLAEAEVQYLDSARKLHSSRKRAAKKLEQSIEKGLAEVAMENARFQVLVSDKLQPLESSNETSSTDQSRFGKKGIDRVEFFFSANPGEDLKPLAKVASGGEASRLMLVLKTVANASEFPRTIVFDEIDSGIGGRVSESVGVKLKKLAETNQVLCVTHQAQIARFADQHFTVEKRVVKGRTVVNIAKLDRQSRVEEIARMLTGSEITDNARRHARELLK